MRTSQRSLLGVFVFSAIAGGALIGLLGRQPAASAGSAPALTGNYIYRFEPPAQTFITITLPDTSQPGALVVSGSNPTHVWITEPSSNRLAHLVYTGTTSTTGTADFQLTELAITSTVNSQPYRLTLQGSELWFTERGANRIGRLDTTGTDYPDEFYDHGLAANAGLADIKVAPNGWVWVVGQASNQLIRLVVTSTDEYAFTAYTHTLLIAPYGLAIESSNSIWFTLPGTHRIGQFAPSYGLFLWPYGLPTNSQPTEIVAAPDMAWISDPQINRIGQVEVGTSTIVNLYGPIDHPVGLASGPPDVFWTTQQNQLGVLGKLVYTSPMSTHVDSYPFPTSGVFPTGIAVASDNGVWSAAYVPVRVCLPAIFRN
jgi:streptogramin lyase